MKKHLLPLVLLLGLAGSASAAIFLGSFETSIGQPPGGAGDTEYIICDFDTAGSCVDSGGDLQWQFTTGSGTWTDDYNDGDIVTTVRHKVGGSSRPNGIDHLCTYTIASGEGRGGSDALKMTVNDTNERDCGFWVIKYKVSGSGNLSNTKTCETYLVGCDYDTADVNRIEMYIKYPSDYKETFSAKQPPEFPNHEIIQFGTYNFNPDLLGTSDTFESENQHFYHQTWPRYDEANGGWIRLVFNMQPTHQRSRPGTEPNNPTRGGDYYNTMTRIYYEPCTQGCNSDANIETSYPYEILVDDIRIFKQAETIPVTVDFTAYDRGEEVIDPPASTAVTFTNSTGAEVCGRVDINAGSSDNTISLTGGTGARCFPNGVTNDTLNMTIGSWWRLLHVTFVPDVVYNNDATHVNVSGDTPSGSPYGDHVGGGFDERRWDDDFDGGEAASNRGYGPNDAAGLHSDFIRVRT